MINCKSGDLSIVMILIIICLALVNALQERRPVEIEWYKSEMKTTIGYFTQLEKTEYENAKFEDYTAHDFAKGIVLNCDVLESTHIYDRILPYYNRIKNNIIPGDIKLRKEFCQKYVESSSSNNCFSRMKIPSEELNEHLLPQKPQTHLDRTCYKALKAFGDDKNKVFDFALYSLRLKVLEENNYNNENFTYMLKQLGLKTLDEKKKEHIISYLKHIADTVTFINPVPKPITYCKYVDWKTMI